MSVFHTSVEHIHEFITIEGSLLGKVFNKDSFLCILPNIEFPLFFGIKQVHDLLIVEFKI